MRCICVSAAILVLSLTAVSAAHAAEKSLAENVRSLEPNVIAVEGKVTKDQRNELRRMLPNDLRARRRKVNEADVKLWRSIKSVKQWETIRDERIAALKKSLGTFPAPPKDLKVRVTKTITGDGFVIRNILFQSRPEWWVTANLYSAAKPTKSMPGLLIIHSHHNPKEQGELQDMGMNWARAGCMVLVMDQLGHGERRQHPFKTSKDYAKSFRVSRQDYFFRYNTGIQLHLLGDGLIGWMAWDLMRGVDLLLKQPGIDPKKIILLGSVAAGGDPCGVTAAIDKRIACAVPFNFGGPQPENVYPLPKDADVSFNYVGGGSWESTRNLRLSARDGFLPWVIVGSVAPRRLIYAHEFSWDKPHDPVWKRFVALYGMYGKPANLASTHGHGRVTLPSSKASHCNNIGREHRKAGIYAAFEKWFGIPAPKEEYRNRRSRSELLCAEGSFGSDSKSSAPVKLQPLTKIAGRLAKQRIGEAAMKLETANSARTGVRKNWAAILGDVRPGKVTGVKAAFKTENGLRVMRLVLNPERSIRVPTVVLAPAKSDKPLAVVVCVAQSGKAAFLKQRADVIASLLDAGCAVCLPDLRGCGETSAGSYRGRRSNATGLSSSEFMLGGTPVGQRLKDLRTVLTWLRSRKEFDAKRIALWGDSFAKTNPPDRNVAVPLDAADQPAHSEPLGHLLALLTPLFEDDIKAAVSNRGGLISFRSVLDSQFVYLPHDAVVPGAIAAGDLRIVIDVLGKTPLWIAAPVTGENKPVPRTKLPWNPRPDAGTAPVWWPREDSAAAAKWLVARLNETAKPRKRQK